MAGHCQHRACDGVCNTVASMDVVDKAVKEDILAHDEKLCIIFFLELRKLVVLIWKKPLSKKFLFPWMKLIDAFRLGKESKVGTNAKPRLIKVRVANSSQRTAILRKAKILKDSAKFFLCVPLLSTLRTSCGKIKIKLEWITTLIDVALFGLHLFSRNCIWSNYC